MYISGYGELHSFTHTAYKKSKYANTHVYKEYYSFVDVVHSLISGEANLAIIPIHNTTIGDIAPAIKAINNQILTEVGEIQLPIKHAIITHPSTSIEDIDTVMSYKIALSQCKSNIREQGWHTKEHSGTATAITEVLENAYPNIAALGPIESIENKPANVLYTSFNDKPNNTTTFKIYKKTNKEGET